MDKFKTLEPVRLYASTSSTTALFRSRSSNVGRNGPTVVPAPFVGKLPSDLHLLVLSHLPVPEIPAYARCSHATAALAQNEKIWEVRWRSMGLDDPALTSVLDGLEEKNLDRARKTRAGAPPTIQVEEDDFGDFEKAKDDVLAPLPGEMGDFVGGFESMKLHSQPFLTSLPHAQKETYRTKYIRVHRLLKPVLKALDSPPHLVLSELAASVQASSLTGEAKTIKLLWRFLSERVQPVNRWRELRMTLRSVMDRFEARLLTAFDAADGKGNEDDMREAAEAGWEIWDAVGQSVLRRKEDWEIGKVWAEKREIFYETGRWDPLANFTDGGGLDFRAMDDFMTAILAAIDEHGSRAVRVFPPASAVILSFSERLATEVLGEYITSLLTRAQEISTDIYLKAVAATFGEAWRIVDAILQAASQRLDSGIEKIQAEDIVYKMFEINMDEYLDEEVETLKRILEKICNTWDRQTTDSHASPIPGASTTRFLASHNPAQVKRNVLASFTSVLLLPVTIVPRTVGAVGGALMTGGTAAVQGIAMLNPQRWGAAMTSPSSGAEYSKRLDGDGGMLFEADEDDLDEKSVIERDKDVSKNFFQPAASVPTSATPNGITSPGAKDSDQLDLLLSLDTALELIHADREALKRVETFAGYPGHYGHRVRDTIEEIFILLLQSLGERHIAKGFNHATDRMKAYEPAEHEGTRSVAPLVQFFELVHVGDTMQSMVQVYFEKELAPHIDKTDFLNAVVREKKRFENTLDDSVAAGLNAGTEVLMNQVEHIILTITKPREYYPPEDAPLELGPTRGCTEAIKCLEMHCQLLKGSTSKEVLEVFYQEVGIRLIAILQKHIKRQIISLSGGFQVISDLNTYHAFIASLKVPSITADFSNLKMLGHVYVVEDAKDLAQIVRDVTRYGGAYRPEDIYEFIQRRSDWKKIEKIVDKTMYNLSFREDCVVC
ncbi:exocyst complex component Sec10-domain-containing protein [Cyathus striatus]|nr:exocyst complex component Sec10-domain-containing protein [Cyathus striatus]